MLRVVLDTNIVVSAYLNPDGVPFAVLKLGLAGAVKICVSEPILVEYRELLQRRSFAMDRRRARLLFRKIEMVAAFYNPAGGVDVANDPDDNMFLECAQAAKAQYLVTGNTADFPKAWKYTRIVNPRTFITLWASMRAADPSAGGGPPA